MKFTDLHVEGFGVWKGLALGNLSESLNVFYGRNEAGKTTLMQFVRAVLYGFSSERRERYLPPLHGEPAGGVLRISVGGQGYEVRRRLLAVDDSLSLGELTLTSDEGTREGQSRLANLLSGIDESIYSNVFAVGLREMQELATLNDTAAADQLYRLTGGLDRVSLVDVMRELEASRRRLLSPDDKPSQISQLLSQWEKLQADIDELAAQGNRWSQLIVQRDGLRQDILDQEQSVARLERQSRQIEVALSVRERWQSREALSGQLTSIGMLPPLPEKAVDKLDALKSGIASRLEQAKRLREQRNKLKHDAAALPINKSLWAQAPRIEALSEHLPWISSLGQQIEALRAEVAQHDKDLGVYYEQMGATQPTSLASLPDVSGKKLSALREPARAIHREQQRMAKSHEEHAAAKREAAEYQQELETALVERDHTDLSEALDEAGDLAAKLRRRVQLEERIDQMLRKHDDLEEEGLDLKEQQVLPLHVLGAIGIVFILGVMMMLTGVFGGLFWSLANATVWFLFGCLAAGSAAAAKFLLERRAATLLQDTKQQMNSVDKQLKQAQKDRDALDRELPSGGGALDVRLQAAQAEVDTLEALLPLDSKRQEAESRARVAETMAADAEGGVKTTRQRWRAALRSIGLPENLSPKQAREFARGCGRTARVRRLREGKLAEFRQREKDLAVLATRILQLLHESGLAPAANDPQAQLKQLIAASAQQKVAVEKRSALRKQTRALLREHQKLRQGAEILRRRMQALIASAGAEDETQLRKLNESHRRCAALVRQRDETALQIGLVLAGQFTEDDVSDLLSKHGLDELARRRDELAEQLDRAQARLTQCFERRGEINHELKTLVTDRRLAEARLELGCVEVRLKQAVRRWQILAVAGRLLESIRSLYETERQPETLGEASRYLRKLTEGRYTRIWTPLGEQTLRIDDEHGAPLSLDVLSSGTREAVFLSLRLALAAAYARRGAVVPLVLDDVLVNFDTERARAAASVLAEFAKGGFQLLLFTCHEHIVRIFRNLQVEVRQLPGRGETLETLPVDEPTALVKLPAAPEPAPEPPPRKKKRRLIEELPPEPNAETPVAALPPAVPPPLPARIYVPLPIVEADSLWRDPLWLDDSFGAFLFDSSWVKPNPIPPKALFRVAKNELPFDVREEEFLFDDEPVVEEAVADERDPSFEELYDDNPEPAYEEPEWEQPDYQPLALVEQTEDFTLHSSTTPHLYEHERRFAWESPEMYWQERTDRAA